MYERETNCGGEKEKIEVMDAMKAVRIHSFGGADCLRFEEAPEPKPASDEVVVKIKTAAVNPVDTKIRAGSFPRFVPGFPAILGRDMSGVVVEAGADVSDFEIGDEVFGMLDYERGTYAEYTVASARELALKPDGLGHEEAGAIGVAAMTAWQSLFEFGKLRRGQRVLVHGASGGVGHYAVQFAAWCGAKVSGTCSAADMEFVRGLGAEIAIDYKAGRFEEELKDMDLVVDLIAGETRERSWQVLRPGGILVSTLPGPKPEGRTDVSGREVLVHSDPAQLAKIGSLMEEGKVKAHIGGVFPLAETRAAHLFLENDHARGKIVLAVS